MTSTSTNTTNERLRVVRMFQDRGVDNAETVVTEALGRGRTLGDLRYDTKVWDGKKNVGPGLLVSMSLTGEAKRPAPRPGPPVYSEAALPLSFMGHDEWLEKRGYPEDECAGVLRAIAASYPVVTIECDTCGFSAGLPHRVLNEFPAIENAVLGG